LNAFLSYYQRAQIKIYFMKRIIACLAGLTFLAIACSKSKETVATVDCSGSAKTFATDVNPVIQANCTSPGCHGSGSSNGPGPLLTFQQIFSARASIRDAVASGRMPQNSSLSSSHRNAILCWIDNGASNN
jgi:hypothetical protein